MNDLKSKIITRTPPRKNGLTPEVQARIGHQLRNMYEDIVRQGVPERFAELIRKLDSGADSSAAASAEDDDHDDDHDLEKHRNAGTRQNTGGD